LIFAVLRGVWCPATWAGKCTTDLTVTDVDVIATPAKRPVLFLEEDSGKVSMHNHENQSVDFFIRKTSRAAGCLDIRMAIESRPKKQCSPSKAVASCSPEKDRTRFSMTTPRANQLLSGNVQTEKICGVKWGFPYFPSQPVKLRMQKPLSPLIFCRRSNTVPTAFMEGTLLLNVRVERWGPSGRQASLPSKGTHSNRIHRARAKAARCT